jgi:rhodanese-related sulfurtransferase
MCETPGEYAEGHLINAKNVDWNGNDFDAQIKTIDKSNTVFVYCQVGGRSESAAENAQIRI